MDFLFFVSIILSLLKLSEGIVLECHFVDHIYGPPHEYFCSVLNSTLVTLKDDRDITKVHGQHSYGNLGIKKFVFI
jgi:hypothetical protein